MNTVFTFGYFIINERNSNLVLVRLFFLIKSRIIMLFQDNSEPPFIRGKLKEVLPRLQDNMFQKRPPLIKDVHQQMVLTRDKNVVTKQVNTTIFSNYLMD